MNYKELCEKREALKRQLAEVESDIRKYDLTIYKGKLEKAISLLRECNPLLSEFIIIDEYINCECCDSDVNYEVYLADIILELEKVARDFEKYARIP